jgi:hypothetical protein
MDAVKLEGGSPARVEAARAIVESGVAVMGHVGLTPQSVSVIGECQRVLPAAAAPAAGAVSCRTSISSRAAGDGVSQHTTSCCTACTCRCTDRDLGQPAMPLTASDWTDCL